MYFYIFLAKLISMPQMQEYFPSGRSLIQITGKDKEVGKMFRFFNDIFFRTINNIVLSEIFHRRLITQ